MVGETSVVSGMCMVVGAMMVSESRMMTDITFANGNSPVIGLSW